MDRVKGEEARLASTLAGDASIPAAWRSAPKDLEELLARDRKTRDRRFFLAEIERSAGYLNSALRSVRWAEERAKPDLARDAGYQDRDLARAKDREKNVSRSLAPLAQRRVLAYLVEKALRATADEPVPALVETFGKSATAAAIEAKLAEMDAKTSLKDEAARLANLTAPLETLRASDDPYVRLAVALSPDLAKTRTYAKEREGALLRIRPAYLSAIRKLRESEKRLLYPDANSTLRVSFAEVKGYTPREALAAAPQTSTKGLLEKETGEEPFASPARVLEALKEKRYGRFHDEALGGVPIAFLSNADTTGGNSGSPAVNGKGELVGLNFDRVWENVAGDFGWNPDRSRNVIVDVRYALWLIETVDGAPWIAKELAGK